MIRIHRRHHPRRLNNVKNINRGERCISKKEGSVRGSVKASIIATKKKMHVVGRGGLHIMNNRKETLAL